MNEQTWIDKSEWGPGEWQDEPDRVEWRDGDVVCLALRQEWHGAWCGYVGVPPGHPWHGVNYGDCGWHLHDCDDDVFCDHRLDLVADAHGGLTFSGPCQEDDRPQEARICHVPNPGEPDDLWWLGFDCHHSGDLAPAHEARMSEYGIGSSLQWADTYRPKSYVLAEVRRLAEQAQVAS